jgi:AbrB family looped-hinge helix DNA binding protein
VEATIDEKGRITIPQELRTKLGLNAGTKILFSVVNSTLLVRKAISAKEFEQIVEEISDGLKSQSDSPIAFEKLF